MIRHDRYQNDHNRIGIARLPGPRNLGVVRGIIVRSRSIVGSIGASLQTLVGGNISIYTDLIVFKALQTGDRVFSPQLRIPITRQDGRPTDDLRSAG